MESTLCHSKSSLPMITNVEALGNREYPEPLAKYEEVVHNSKLFMFTLKSVHASLGTEFRIPTIGGTELNLHRLFVEVTSRGGIVKLILEGRWKNVTSAFNFPSTATDAAFVLRKHYASLLYQYEQIYYFKARQWNPASYDGIQYVSTLPDPSEIQPLVFQQSNVNAATAASSSGSPVTGVIDGKFEGGYLVTVTMGSEKLKGVLYEAASSSGSPVTGVIDGKIEGGYLVAVTMGSEKLKGVLYEAASSSGSLVTGVIDGKFEGGYLVTVTMGSEKLKGVLYEASQNPVLSASYASAYNAYASLGFHRRKRRKKSEIKRRDPARPKHIRSGYNFFFAEQRPRLKSLHQVKDTEIVRMIVELGNKLTESEKIVYQEKAIKDKERYKVEMEDYLLKLKTGKGISDVVPLQQLPESDTDMKLDEAMVDSPGTSEESDFSGSDYEDDKAAEKDFDMDGLSIIGEGAGSSCLGPEEMLSKGGL